jgi:hypothetical protein
MVSNILQINNNLLISVLMKSKLYENVYQSHNFSSLKITLVS